MIEDDDTRERLLGDASAALKLIEQAEVALLFCQVNGKPGVVLGVPRPAKDPKQTRVLPLFIRIRGDEEIMTTDGQKANLVADDDPLLTEIYGPKVSKSVN